MQDVHPVYPSIPTQMQKKGLNYEQENCMSSVRVNENMNAASDSLVIGLVQPTHFFA